MYYQKTKKEIESTTKGAYLRAVRLLTSKDYSKHKLVQKLKEAGFQPEHIDEAVEELLSKKFLREENYAEARIKAFMNKGYSPYYILQKLAQENVYVDESFIRNIFQEYNITEEDQIRKLIKKKSTNEKDKLIRFLHSKGHSLSVVSHILKNCDIDSA